MTIQKKALEAKLAAEKVDPLNPKAVYKLVGTKELIEVVAFYPSMNFDDGRAFGYGLVAENTLAAKYVATVQKTDAKQVLHDHERNAPADRHQQFTCQSCKKHIRLAELATTVAKRDEKQKADATAKVAKWTTCPPCRAEQQKRGASNRKAL